MKHYCICASIQQSYNYKLDAHTRNLATTLTVQHGLEKCYKLFIRSIYYFVNGVKFILKQFCKQGSMKILAYLKTSILEVDIYLC